MTRDEFDALLNEHWDLARKVEENSRDSARVAACMCIQDALEIEQQLLSAYDEMAAQIAELKATLDSWMIDYD